MVEQFAITFIFFYRVVYCLNKTGKVFLILIIFRQVFFYLPFKKFIKAHIAIITRQRW